MTVPFMASDIMTLGEFRRAYRAGPYAWPGGYPMYAVTDDGGCLCWACLKSERRNILEAIAHRLRDGWLVVAVDINYEDTELACDHCSKTIESAYGDREACPAA